VKGVWSGITGWFGDLWSGVTSTWSGLWDSLPDGSEVLDNLKTVWASIPDFFGDLWGRVKGSFGEIVGWMKSKVEWLRGVVAEVLSLFGVGKKETPEEKEHRQQRESAAKDYAENTLGPAMDGFGLPPTDNTDVSVSPIQQSINRAEQIVNNKRISTTVHQQNSISIHPAPGQDSEAIAAEVMRKLKEMEDNGGVLYDHAGF